MILFYRTLEKSGTAEVRSAAKPAHAVRGRQDLAEYGLGRGFIGKPIENGGGALSVRRDSGGGVWVRR